MKKFLHTILAIILVIAFVMPIQLVKASEENYKTPFKDIISAHPYYDILHQMRDKGIITGYDDGNFKPYVKINRQHAAVLIQRVKILKPKVKLKQYTDITKTHPYYNAIMQLQQTGLIKDNAKGSFDPNKDLTRGEMALILANAFNLTAKGNHPFKDVSQITEEGKAIAALYEVGITTGYDESTFNPDESLSRAHYTVFLYRALKYEENAQNQGEEMTSEKDIPKMSMDMSLEDYKKVVANDKSLYDIEPGYNVAEFAFNDLRFKKLLIEGQSFVKQTNFKYKAAGAYIRLQEPDWVNTLPPGFMATQISIHINNKTKDIWFNIDFTSENAVDLTRQLFTLAYPELASLDGKIAELTKEAREAYKVEKNVPPGEREFRGNITVEEIGEYKINFGTDSRMEFFHIDVERKIMEM